MAIQFLSSVSITGTTSVSSIANDNSSYTGILVWDGGNLKYRTKSQILSDIGATGNTGTVTSVTVQGTTGLSGSGTVTTSGTITLTNSDRGSSQSIYKNIASDSGTATANSNNDTLTISGGTNVTTARSGDTITINATDTTTNNFVSSLSFNTGTGVLTAARSGLSSLTVDLDGRYLELGGGTMTGDITLSTDADILKAGTNPFRVFTNGTEALSISSSQNATFAGTVMIVPETLEMGGNWIIQGTDGSYFQRIKTIDSSGADAETFSFDVKLGGAAAYKQLLVLNQNDSIGGTFLGNLTVSGGTLNLGNDVSIFDDGVNILRTDDQLHANNDIYLGGAGKIFDRANNSNYIEVADTIVVSTALYVGSDITVAGGDITLQGTGRIQGVDTVSAGTDAANKTYVDNAVAGSGSGTVTSVATGNGISGGTITSTGTLTVGAGDGLSQSSTGLLVDSTVVRTSGTQSIAGTKTFTGVSVFSNSAGLQTSRIDCQTGQQLVLNAGESSGQATGQTNELVYLNAESGLEINSSPDNWSSGWAGRNNAYINRADATSSLPGVLTVKTGITLTGTGRIQGVDTVSSGTDAANKTYVDNAISGVPQGDITAVVAGTGLSGGGTSGSVTLNNTITNNNQLSNGSGYITASSTNTLTNKSGNISQWTNDSGYLTSAGSMSSWTLTADSGGSETISNGESVDIAGGTNITTVRSGATVTINTSATTNTGTVTSVGFSHGGNAFTTGGAASNK